MMIRLPLFLLLFLTSCRSGPEGKHSPEAGVKKVYYPYVSRKDLDFSKEDPELAEPVLRFLKKYEVGNAGTSPASFADSITVVLPDTLLTGSRVDVLTRYQRRRAALGIVQLHIDDWKVVYNGTDGEYWVLVWLQLQARSSRGIDRAFALHQVWRFNAAGRIYSWQEFTSRFRW